MPKELSAYGVFSINCGCDDDSDGIDGFGSEIRVELGYPERKRNGLPGELWKEGNKHDVEKGC